MPVTPDKAAKSHRSFDLASLCEHIDEYLNRRYQKKGSVQFPLPAALGKDMRRKNIRQSTVLKAVRIYGDFGWTVAYRPPDPDFPHGALHFKASRP